MSSDQVGFPATDKAVVHRIMGLVQCTPDQAPGACRRCLQALIDEMPAVFNATVGGRFLAVWCYLRFEVHEFYDSSPMLNLVAPPWSPPPSPASADQTGGRGCPSDEFHIPPLEKWTDTEHTKKTMTMMHRFCLICQR
uniref:Gnk2-homologous domain-containing protein n=1 Tax=Setaria viridis TaxID=4556 RepID=A0A4U6SVN6_SETVI|nr:hypothetical protein SEVIR_9G142950v2 [Setaria viridis]